MDIIENFKHYGAYKLARMAEVAQPDSHSSAGARFLTSVRDTVIKRVEDALEQHGGLADALREEEDRISNEVSDAAPDADPDVMWREYVDLAAYREDLDDLDEIVDRSPRGMAEIALVNIAFRLIQALLEEIKGAAK